jgi:hypothetical protein
MDEKKVAAEAKELIPYIPALADKEQVDGAVEVLINALHRIADATTPRRKRSYGDGFKWWNPEVDKAVREAKKALRGYQKAPTETNWYRL